MSTPQTRPCAFASAAAGQAGVLLAGAGSVRPEPPRADDAQLTA